jgi:DNA polymerase-1
MKAYLSGNIYIETAAKLFGKKVEKDTPLYTVAKSIVLGTDYDMQEWKLAMDLRDKLGVMLAPKWEDHLKEARRLLDKYHALYPGIGKFMLRKEAELLKYGYVTTATGRRRNLPCPHGQDTEGYWHLQNSAINAPIQGLASDITGSALIDVESAILQEYHISLWDYHYALYDKQWPDIPILINEVHDDLVVDYPNTDAKRHKRDVELVVETMKQVRSLRKLVPSFDLVLNVEAQVGKHWGAK